MSFNVIATPRFRRALKRLVKKFPSLKNEYAALIETLRLAPDTGTPLGHDCYKIRLAIASKGKGKSGGARVITHLYIAGHTVFLLSIYDKAEQDSLSDSELIQLIREI